MDKQQAQQLLGLDDSFTAADVADAVAAKRTQTTQKRDAAPTDALKAKFDQLLTQLAEAEAVLKPTKSASSLSQTKLADLPSMAPGDADQLALQPGQVISGRYRIEELLGQGGMGAVYRAFDTNREEDIAIKVLLPSLARNERARERFMNEARVSSRLSHPNIVNVFDVQKDGDLVFLTMELLEGQDLRALMENNRAAHLQFPIEDVKDIVKAVSDALTNAHETTVHRDIKPENIWFGSDGKIKLMDFGIAQVQSTSQRTKTGAAMGTAYYMAPEQLKGLTNIDGRADQYAVAVMAYELLTGEVPAGAIEPVQDLRKDVPAGMAAAVMKALSPRPENRFETMAAFYQAFQHGKPAKVRGAKSTGGRSPMLAWGAALVLVVAITGGLFASGSITTETIKSWLPASKEEIAAQKAAIARVQGEIGLLRKRLEEQRRQLATDLREAEREGYEFASELRHWQSLTESLVFSTEHWVEIEGETSLAESFLKDGQYAKASASFENIRKTLQLRSDYFLQAKDVYPAQKVAEDTRAEWQQYGLDQVPLGIQAEERYAQALAAGERGELVGQVRLFDESVAIYTQLNVAVGQLRAGSMRRYQEAEGKWKALAKTHGFSADSNVQAAEVIVADAEDAMRKGEFDAAEVLFSQAVEKIDVAHNAGLAEVRRRENLAEQARLAEAKLREKYNYAKQHLEKLVLESYGEVWERPEDRYVDRRSRQIKPYGVKAYVSLGSSLVGCKVVFYTYRKTYTDSYNPKDFRYDGFYRIEIGGQEGLDWNVQVGNHKPEKIEDKYTNFPSFELSSIDANSLVLMSLKERPKYNDWSDMDFRDLKWDPKESTGTNYKDFTVYNVALMDRWKKMIEVCGK